MSEHFMNDLITKISPIVDRELLDEIKIRIAKVMQDYDISEKPRELVKYNPYIPDCYMAYMIAKKVEGRSDATLSQYKMFLEHMFMNIGKPLDKITSNDIRIYLYKTKEERNIKATSLERRRCALSTFFSWCSDEGYLQTNPMAVIAPIKYEMPKVRPLTDMELERLRMACTTPIQRAVFEVMYSTGCRVSELSHLNMGDINFDKNEVYLFGKGGKHRTSYLNAKAVLCLKEYINTRVAEDGEDALFCYSRYPHTRMLSRGIERMIDKIGDNAGIPEVHCHMLRHTMATNMLKRGGDITQVQKILGHSNIQTTMIYADVDMASVKMAHSKSI